MIVCVYVLFYQKHHQLLVPGSFLSRTEMFLRRCLSVFPAQSECQIDHINEANWLLVLCQLCRSNEVHVNTLV